MKKTVLILKAPGDGETVVDAIALRWSAAGHRVLTHHGPRGLPAADVVVLHLNRTRVPAAYRRALRSYPVVVNGRAVDISKPLYCEHAVSRTDDYDGPVIIKTKLNFGGGAEHNRIWLPLRVLSLRVLGRAWRTRAVLDPLDYPILDRKSDVPKGVWANPRLLVERFLPEREGELFFLRYWLFLGDQGWACRFGSRKPVVKFPTRVTPEERVPVPDELVELRRRLGVDYGRIDYVEHDGRPVVFDVNKTLGASGEMSEWDDELDILARGMESFLSPAVA
jgi:hypothetical protein